MSIPPPLEPARSLLAVIDLQEAFRAQIPDFEVLAERTQFVAAAAGLLRIPVVVSEQYPSRLGSTAHELDEVLAGVTRVPKRTFNAMAEPEFAAALQGHQRSQVIITGIETHICVQQTALELARQGLEVHLLVDVTGSQRDSDRDVALGRMQAAGIVLTTAESALYELVADSRAPEFRAFLELVKARLDADRTNA